MNLAKAPDREIRKKSPTFHGPSMVIKPISLLKESLILIGLIIGNTTTNHSVQLQTVDWRTITYKQLCNFIVWQVNFF